MGIMEKKMETGLCWDTGKENGNYYRDSIAKGLCWDNGKEHGNGWFRAWGCLGLRDF